MKNIAIFSPKGQPVTLNDNSVIPISRAFQVDNILYLSGQLALNQNGEIIGNDIETQTIQTIENINSLLSESRCGLDDVFKVTVWLTRLEDFPGFNRIYGKYFNRNFPVRSTVRADLMLPEALIEIEVMACINNKKLSVHLGSVNN